MRKDISESQRAEDKALLSEMIGDFESRFHSGGARPEHDALVESTSKTIEGVADAAVTSNQSALRVLRDSYANVVTHIGAERIASASKENDLEAMKRGYGDVAHALLDHPRILDDKTVKEGFSKLLQGLHEAGDDSIVQHWSGATRIGLTHEHLDLIKEAAISCKWAAYESHEGSNETVYKAVVVPGIVNARVPGAEDHLIDPSLNRAKSTDVSAKIG